MWLESIGWFSEHVALKIGGRLPVEIDWRRSLRQDRKRPVHGLDANLESNTKLFLTSSLLCSPKVWKATCMLIAYPLGKPWKFSQSGYASLGYEYPPVLFPGFLSAGFPTLRPFRIVAASIS